MQKQKVIPRHLIVACSAWISRISAAVTQLVVIRLIIEHLGEGAYAIFALLIGLTTWFTLCEFGIGYSLQNYVSEHRASNEDPSVHVYAGLLVGIIVVGIVIALIVMLGPFLGPLYLKGIDGWTDNEKAELFTAAGILLAGTALGSIAYKLWYGEQKGYIANLMITVASWTGLGLSYLVLGSDLENKTYFVVTAFLLPSACLPSMAIITRVLSLYPRFRLEFGVLVRLLRRGMNFWLFSILSVLVLNIDYLVLSQYVDSTGITQYAITQKILGFMLAIYGAILMALWPEFSEHWATSQIDKIREKIRRYLPLGLVLMISSGVVLVSFEDQITALISGGSNLHIPGMFVFMVTLYYCLRIWTDTFATSLQSASDLSAFWKWVPAQALISVFLQIFLVSRYGIYGVMGGLIISFLATVAWALPKALSDRMICCNAKTD